MLERVYSWEVMQVKDYKQKRIKRKGVSERL